MQAFEERGKVLYLPETFFTVWPPMCLIVPGSSPVKVFWCTAAAAVLGQPPSRDKALGSKVFTTAGSAEKCAACQRLGADVAANYTEQEYVKVLMEATDGQGIDVILDMVGGDYVARNLELATEDGRVVSISFLKESQVEIDMMQILRKKLTVSGSTLRPRTPEAKAGIAQKLRAKIWPLIENQKIKPLIAARFALADAVEAHKLMESSKHIGKIICADDIFELCEVITPFGDA